jgi:intracellular sulfur oxidation DsrE/DsrF family protein
MLDESNSPTPRRSFIGQMAAATVGAGAVAFLPDLVHATAAPAASVDPGLESWFGRLTGKHRVVFDAPGVNEGMPAIWPRVYLITTEATYPGETATAMVILRHKAIALGLGDSVWSKYHLGESLDIKNGAVPATSNPFATITGLPIPGLGIVELLKGGVLVGVCDVALTIASGAAAAKMGMEAATVKQEWVAALFPGIQVVPSGVMAVARAQEFSTQYIFAG